MKIYRLHKGSESIEVTEGREDRRDKLIAAGYEWVNAADTSGGEVAQSNVDPVTLDAPAAPLKGGKPKSDPRPDWLKKDEDDDAESE